MLLLPNANLILSTRVTAVNQLAVGSDSAYRSEKTRMKRRQNALAKIRAPIFEHQSDIF